MYAKYYGVDTPMVRFHHATGPRAQPDLALSIFTESIILGQKPIVHGKFIDGKFHSSAADFTNIHDAVRGILMVARFSGYEVFNLGTGRTITVEALAKLAMKYLNKKIGILHKEMLPHESLIHQADITKAKKILGWTATIPVEESVRSYVEWRLKTGRRKAARYQ